MKVLHVIPSVSELRGGPTFVLGRIAAGLASRGITVDVACTNDDGKTLLDVPLGVPVERDGSSTYFFQRDTYFYSVSKSLCAWLWRNVGEYDVIHVHALFNFPTLAAAIAAHRHRTPYIVRPLGTLNNWGFENRRPALKKLSYSLIERNLLRGAAAIHLTSEQERREVLARYPAQAKASIIPDFIHKKTVVIHEPSEMPIRGRDSRKIDDLRAKIAGRKLILFLSRIDKKKGLDILLPAFAQIHKHFPDTVLVVAGQGDPEYVASLRDQAEALGISGGIIWVGFISGDAKWALYRLADVFVLPSYSENFAVVVLEAMSCGTPVLLTENVALAEEFRPHSAAIVVQATVNSVAQGLCSLLADPGFAERLGEHGREIALANFSEEACISKMLALYEHVIKTRGSGRSAPTATVKNPESQKQTLTP